MVAEAKCKYLRVEIAQSNMAHIQYWEHNLNDSMPINPSVKHAVVMNVHIETPYFVSPHTFFTSTPQTSKKKKKHHKTK